MRAIILALSLCFVGASFDQAQAQTAAGAASSATEITAPQEVGNTSMPPGNYTVTERSSGKTYELMVSSKGTMILAPVVKAAAAAAPAAAATTVAVPAAAGAAPAAGAAAAPVGPAAAPAGGLAGMLNNPMASSAVKGLMNTGMKKAIEKNATKELNKFLK
ncbi:MAG: hypothetical protein JSS83_01875 [Cyanobacteria bacterium SZAS LIN-3]|nr:hypothetical protein [Cyanobacteria bacterium SZAS LIN-3]